MHVHHISLCAPPPGIANRAPVDAPVHRACDLESWVFARSVAGPLIILVLVLLMNPSPDFHRGCPVYVSQGREEGPSGP